MKALQIREFRISRIIGIILLLLITLINLFPIVNLVLNSFRPNFSIVRQPLGLDNLSFSNYPIAQDFGNLTLGVLNGCIISGLTIVMLLLTGTLGAYALSFIELPLKFRKVLKSAISIGYFIPQASILIPTFLTLGTFRLTNTYGGIVFVYCFLYMPITMIILTGYLGNIPKTIVEAAMIDGANPLVSFWRVVLPMSKSVLVSVVILVFLWTYNDFLWPLILMARPAKRTIAVALTMFYDDRQQDFGLLSAAVCISLIPIMSVYMILKEKIMSGMAAGSIKE